MCNMNCRNCYYREINPADDSGHCYMFKHEPEGDCLQFKLSKAAVKSAKEMLNQKQGSSTPGPETWV